jgi:hypothetical protein
MARAWAELQQLSKDELIREYDEVARRTDIESLAFIRDVIFQRDLEEQEARMEQTTREMARLTAQIRWLTVIIAVLTVISTVAVWRGS